MKLAALLFLSVTSLSIATTTRSNITFPEFAAQNCIEGWVELELTIELNGSVESAEVLDSEPPGIFDQAAVDSMSQWRFEPSDVKYRKTQTIDFLIEAECSQNTKP